VLTASQGRRGGDTPLWYLLPLVLLVGLGAGVLRRRSRS
jgi:hypothetical protein